MYAITQRQHNLNEEEIRNLFSFLGGEDSNTKDILKASNVIFGLENYGLPLSAENIHHLKVEIEKRSEKGNISFEDFKALWTANVENKIPAKDVAHHFFGLIMEILSTTPLVKEMMRKDPNFKMDRINKEMLKELLQILNVLEETPDLPPSEENESFDKRRSTILRNTRSSIEKGGRRAILLDVVYKREIDNIETIAEEMIDVLDSDADDFVTLKEFEFVINEYLNSLK